jgi:AcrR family transcriptional regulator
MRLFAERGFGATSVADIESAVGLQPSRGGLYKHFANKLDLLETAVRRCLDDAATVAVSVDSIDVAGVAPDPAAIRGTVVALGSLFLDEMDSLEELTRVLEHDAKRLPELTAAVKSRMVDLSYASATRLVAEVAPHLRDPQAVAVVALGSLVAARRTLWTFGAPPASVSDERLLDAWADATVAALQIGDTSPARESR